jgi:hypothetical protein
MNAKERFYSGMARETISKITASKDNWTAFLTTMARNYNVLTSSELLANKLVPQIMKQLGFEMK